MRIYISGRTYGLEPSEASQIFGQYTQELEANGYTVQNPFRMIGEINKSRKRMGEQSWTFASHRQSVLRTCIRALVNCDAIFMIPDWQKCEKSKQELEIAKTMKMPIYYSIEELKTATSHDITALN